MATFFLAVVLGACSDGGGGAENGVSADDARKAIQAADLGDEDTIGALDPLRDSDTAVKVAADALKKGARGDELWAAAYVYANGGADPKPLESLVDHDDVAIRVLAGIGLVANGAVEGFGPLIDALGEADDMAGSFPPTPVWSVAASTLVRFTAISEHGPAFDADDADRRAAQQRWRDWLAANQKRLRFDAETELWDVR